ncbi:ANTAR domain-containing protein [Terrabacter sp. NPDC080008]|uniref:ANTAR domain-containing protein n=1 Tax=Terrabacter sp. NPDC080008 TaxID=3155176 RepID=UPI00344CA23D
MDLHDARHEGYDLICLATGVLMQHGTVGSDEAFDELLDLAIGRGETLELTAYLVVRSAELGHPLADDDAPNGDRA